MVGVCKAEELMWLKVVGADMWSEISKAQLWDQSDMKR